MDLMYTVQLLGNVRDFLGAIAVVATLGYLAVQIRQSNLASQATAIQSFFDAFSTVNVGPSRDVRFVQLIRRGFNEWEDLSKDEQAQMHLYWNDYISKVHMGYRLYERGILDEGSYTGWENFLLAALQTPGVLGVWSAGKAVYPSDFLPASSAVSLTKPHVLHRSPTRSAIGGLTDRDSGLLLAASASLDVE